MSEGIDEVAGDIVGRLEQAWNTGDGDAFAAPFAEDADFVTVRGEFFRTRPSIAQGHRLIFSTIYKDSVNRIELLRARAIGGGLIVAHARATLSVPGGPLAGEHRAVMSMLLVQVDGGWEIETFHNTFRMPSPPGPPDIASFKDYAADS
jgi:uncharacterized protein (TIGR02246 family)